MKLEEYIKKHGNVEIEEKALNELLGIQESKIWKPKNDEYYWYIMSTGCINSNKWLDTIENKEHFLFGNVYSRYEQAEYEIEKRKVEVELQRFAIEHNDGEIDWNNYVQFKYCIYFDYGTKEISIWHYSKHKYDGVYFTSTEITVQAIQAIGEDRLKKYYFGVEE